MKRQLAIATLLAACVAAGGAAQADVVKCVDAHGHVTLTDMPCGSGTVVPVAETEAPAGAGPSVTADYGYREPPPPPDPLRVGATRIHLSPAEFGPAGSSRNRYAHLARPTPGQSLVTDAATLRAARMSLELRSDLGTVASR